VTGNFEKFLNLARSIQWHSPQATTGCDSPTAIVLYRLIEQLYTYYVLLSVRFFKTNGVDSIIVNGAQLHLVRTRLMIHSQHSAFVPPMPSDARGYMHGKAMCSCSTLDNQINWHSNDGRSRGPNQAIGDGDGDDLDLSSMRPSGHGP